MADTGAIQKQMRSLREAINSQYETPQGARCLESDVVQWFSISPALCKLIFELTALEGKLYVLERKDG